MVALSHVKCGILLVYLVNNIVLTTQNEDDISGVQFPEDILIGRSVLTDNANQWDRHLQEYHITLMPVEGNSSNFIFQKSGYFIGFQWYNEMYNEYPSRSIKWQLYSHQRDYIFGSRDENIAGNYILLNQTEWINATKGFNYYLFTEPIKMDMADSNKEFVIGFMVNKFMDSPILHDYCTGYYKPVLYTTLRDLPHEGEIVTFPPQTDSLEMCVSYSFQGIFLPSDKASYYYGGCDMYIARLNNGTMISRYGESAISDTYRGTPTCIIVRAEKPSLSLEITTIDFSLPYSGECDDSQLQVGDKKSLNGYDYSLWGTYCGSKSDIFDNKHVNNPYLDINWDINSRYSDFDTGFQFKVVAKDDYYAMLIAIIVGSIIAAILLLSIIGCIICICCGCCICCKKKKGTVNTRGTTGTTGVATTPASGASYPVQQPYPVQQLTPDPMGPPPSHLPPISGNTYGNANPGYYQPTPYGVNQVPQQQPYMGGETAAPPPAYGDLYKQAPTGDTVVSQDDSTQPQKTDL